MSGGFGNDSYTVVVCRWWSTVRCCDPWKYNTKKVEMSDLLFGVQFYP